MKNMSELENINSLRHYYSIEIAGWVLEVKETTSIKDFKDSAMNILKKNDEQFGAFKAVIERDPMTCQVIGYLYIEFKNNVTKFKFQDSEHNDIQPSDNDLCIGGQFIGKS